MSSLTVFMIFMGAVVTFMGVICPFPPCFLRVPKETKDLQWVEAFHPGIYFYEIFVYLCAAKKIGKSELPVAFHHCLGGSLQHSQYTLKPEHLTTLSRTPAHSKKKKKDHISSKYQTVVPYCLASGNLWTLPALQTPPTPTHLPTPTKLTPENNSHRHGNNLTHRLEFFILTGPIAFFIVLLHSDFSPGC